MQYGQMELTLLSLAWKLGLHPSVLVELTPITRSLPKYWLLGPLHSICSTMDKLTVVIWDLYVVWTDGTKFTQSCLETRLASIHFISFEQSFQQFTKQVPMGPLHGIGGTFCQMTVLVCNLYGLLLDGTQFTQSCLESRLASINFSSCAYHYQKLTIQMYCGEIDSKYQPCLETRLAYINFCSFEQYYQ